MLGYTPEEPQLLSVRQLIDAGEISNSGQGLEALGENNLQICERIFPSKTGEKISNEIHAQIVRDACARPLYFKGLWKHTKHQ
jgi:hypothetical protein